MVSVAIVGPGGVGGLVGALLARAGEDVVYVARPETAAALNAHGIAVHSVRFGDFTVPARAVTVLTAPAALVVVATKATTLDDALGRVPQDGADLILPLLNGVDHMGLLRSRYPSARVVAGSIRVESTRVAPGRISHTSDFCRVELAGPGSGPGSGFGPGSGVAEIAAVLSSAGLDVIVRDSESALLWDKMSLLAPLALITTVTRSSVGAAREMRRADLVDIVAEVAAVARANGTRTDAARMLDVIDQIPAPMKSSMLRDAEAGRPLELDAIGGAVLRAGQAAGIPTPATARVVAELRQ
ncbi:ketopantoate reductase family protein [Dactylosporangium sp. CA-052675]|uniref:ketopantoate reductase family protein n=1 Tax=Dactylosporangium sp. CA-052675 TaxID=3239927 RepID=UPI003D919DF7